MAAPSLFSSTNLKIIIRGFYRNRSYAILNMLGLVVGFTVFIFAAAYVYFETHYENFHGNANRIYRATYLFAPSGNTHSHWARVPVDFVNELPADVPAVKTLIRFQNQERKYVRVGNDKFRPAHAYVTDKEVFSVFDFKLLTGNPAQALAQPHSVVISKSLAKKYYGETNAMGRDIFLIGDYDKVETLHHITGVMEDLPSNTHLPVDMLISFRDSKERSGWAYTYLLLENGATISQVEAAIPSFIKKYDAVEGKDTHFTFQPLSDIHLTSHLAREIIPGGENLYVRVVGFAGLLVLVMAVINFTNLNSAMSLGRAKEFGMRKVMGASRRQLIYYLATESVIVHFTALLLASGVAYLLFPYMQQFVNIEFLPPFMWFTVAMIIVALAMGVASSLYPVVLLTALQPVAVLKTTKAISITGREGAFSLKRIMVTMQFGISILLIGSAAIAYHQFNYLLHKNLGIEREQVIAIPAVPDGVKNKFESFRSRLVGQRGIVSVSACMEVPSREIRDSGLVLVEGSNSDKNKAPQMDIQVIDPDVVSLLGLRLAAGRNIQSPSKPTSIPEFNENYTFQQYLLTQPREYLINETAMHQLGWNSPQDAIGQKISWSLDDMALAPGPIVGIVQDFHQETLKNKVDPVILVNEPLWLRTFLIKAETGNMQGSIEKISGTWNELFPFYPMEYFFLDDLYNNLYKAERIQVQLLFGFSGLAILIAFTGLVGLVAYALKTRTKELAVRKVLGASVTDLIRLMSYEYLIVLLIGAVLAIPLSIYGLNEWLSGFAYHVSISPLAYALTLLLILLLLLVTVSMQTLKASGANPADTLRDE
ncbi:MAG TPA: FtsX-like permease family protein [Cyclobacteriaceae bacterium]|nr:FtsX-like permease family protein [Cyclobacteriaceae bacterium]